MKGNVASLLLVSAMATSATAAVDISVHGSGSTSLDNNVSQVPFEIEHVTGGGGAKSVSGSGNQQILNDVYGLISAASGSGFASADIGLLRVKVDGVALIGPGAPNVPTVTHGTPRVDAEFRASFEDSISIVSATLPIGSTATFTATIRMNVVTNNPGFNTGDYGFSFFVGSTSSNYVFPNGLYPTAPSFELDSPVEITGKVGDVIPVGASLGARTDNRAGFYTGPGGVQSNWGDSSETHIDASHTARVFLDPVTADIVLVSESGHNFSISAVPEPGAYLLMLAGLALVCARVRRKAAAGVFARHFPACAAGSGRG